jgi:hypothetical protein
MDFNFFIFKKNDLKIKLKDKWIGTIYTPTDYNSHN